MIGILYGFIIFNPHEHPLKVSAMNNLYPEHFAYKLMKEAYLKKQKQKKKPLIHILMWLWRFESKHVAGNWYQGKWYKLRGAEYGVVWLGD